VLVPTVFIVKNLIKDRKKNDIQRYYLGAIAGQLIGNNTAGTLIGTSVGTFVGFIAGNVVDQYYTNQHLQQLEQKQMKQRAYASADGQGDSPPGEWVQTKGQWIDGNWVPSYKKWVPVNP